MRPTHFVPVEDPVDEATRTHLEIVAARARAISDTLARSRIEVLDRSDPTRHEVSRLTDRAHDLISDPHLAELLPERVEPAELGRGVSKLAVMAAARGVAALIETFLARDAGRLEELERDKQTLEAKLLEAEARAITIKDDELRERCVDLLLRPGKLDTAVRDACTVLEHRLRKVTGLPKEALGVALVDKALNKKDGKLIVSDVEAEQEGFHLLCRGVIGFFKNPTSHRLIGDYGLTRARQVVGLVDTLLDLLREAKKRTE
jgi:uncharacterized protein (TIGR02391 family)